jgi:hypothetical protein
MSGRAAKSAGDVSRPSEKWTYGRRMLASSEGSRIRTRTTRPGSSWFLHHRRTSTHEPSQPEVASLPELLVFPEGPWPPTGRFRGRQPGVGCPPWHMRDPSAWTPAPDLETGSSPQACSGVSASLSSPSSRPRQRPPQGYGNLKAGTAQGCGSNSPLPPESLELSAEFDLGFAQPRLRQGIRTELRASRNPARPGSRRQVV